MCVQVLSSYWKHRSKDWNRRFLSFNFLISVSVCRVPKPHGEQAISREKPFQVVCYSSTPILQLNLLLEKKRADIKWSVAASKSWMNAVKMTRVFIMLELSLLVLYVSLLLLDILKIENMFDSWLTL